MTLPAFDANDTSTYPPANLFTDSLPRKDFPEGGRMGQSGGPGTHQRQRGGHQIPPEKLKKIPPEHRGSQESMDGMPPNAGTSSHTAKRMKGSGFTRNFTFATGYLATALLGLTLLIGPANLLLRRRIPVSSYLRRDVGIWTAVVSFVHVIFGIDVHASITDPIPMFIEDGSPLTNSFGLANWTGLAATVIAAGLLALSSDFALRKLKAKNWKRLQRLNYALFALVFAHAFFYGALLQAASPFTLLLLVSVTAVFAGQAIGVWLYRKRYSRRTAVAAS